MGHKHDQDYSAPVRRPTPPPLPPRQSLMSLPSPDATPPPYSEHAPTYHSQPLTSSWTAQDPRTSSTQSLVPHNSISNASKRTLLLIYVHGFLGNETSFQSFPAHVHNAVTERLGSSHVVHTKIYPRYKTRKRVEEGSEKFSEWLGPHESPDTDVILLGHSMGGILSAEVTLLAPYTAGSIREFRHRILGTVNFDTPFLGMHPGVITSGLGSLFRPAPETPVPKTATTRTESQDAGHLSDNAQSSVSPCYFGPTTSNVATPLPTDSSSLSSTALSIANPISIDRPTDDPNYDPPFPNDVRISQRTGWSNAWHFINKHSDGLARATKSYVTSHLEFGGALADYNGLKNRYGRIRGLENRKEGPRVRFANYYTASTGRPKRSKQSGDTSVCQINGGTIRHQDEVSQTSVGDAGQQVPSASSGHSSERANSENQLEHDKQMLDPKHLRVEDGSHDEDEGALTDGSKGMEQIAPAPVTDDEDAIEEILLSNKNNTSITDGALDGSIHPSVENRSATAVLANPSLPPIPAAPEEPPPFVCAYEDKEMRKLAKNSHDRDVKAYQNALRDRDKAIKDRRKFLEKRDKDASRERDKEALKEEKQRKRKEAELKKRQAKEKARAPRSTGNTNSSDESALTTKPSNVDGVSSVKEAKLPRDRKFCLLPSRVNGEIDRCWVRVFMPGVDEVGAHCGLFFVDGERYQTFVGNVSARIVEWVEESMEA